MLVKSLYITGLEYAGCVGIVFAIGAFNSLEVASYLKTIQPLTITITGVFFVGGTIINHASLIVKRNKITEGQQQANEEHIN